MPRTGIVVVGLSALSLLPAGARAASIEFLDTLPGWPGIGVFAMSGDGSTVGGRTGGSDSFNGYVGTSAGAVATGDLPGGRETAIVYGLNWNGDVAVGTSVSSNGFEAFRWTRDGGIVGLGSLNASNFDSEARAVTADGETVVGITQVTGSAQQAFRWTPDGGMEALGVPSGFDASGASAITADGRFIAGSAVDFRYGQRPDRVDEAFLLDTESGEFTLLGNLAANYSSRAMGISDDGTTVVGSALLPDAAGGVAFRWRDETGLVALGPGGQSSVARDADATGNIIVGNRFLDTGDAFIWTEHLGMTSLQTLLEASGVDLQGAQLNSLDGISANGRYVGGTANLNGTATAFIADLDGIRLIPEPTSALAGVSLLSALMLRRRTGRGL